MAGRTRPILLNGCTVEIRETLYSFLIALIHHFNTVLLWTDAICIDLSDDTEKRSQVIMMGDLYRSADCVYAWPGEGNAETDLAFDFLKESAEPSLDDARVQDQCFENVLLNQYWRRVWTLQGRI